MTFSPLSPHLLIVLSSTQAAAKLGLFVEGLPGFFSGPLPSPPAFEFGEGDSWRRGWKQKNIE
jgi:hypothetical protein